MSNIIMQKDNNFLKQLNNALKTNTNLTNWELFKLLYQYKQISLISEFDELQVLKMLPHVSFLDHQIKTAQQVILQMNGRAILADEVGLGKTIEAGLILKEYLVRGLVKKILILVPSTLVNQWVNELQNKFFLSVVSYRKNYHWDHYPIMIASIDLAKREPHREEILKIDYDLVIVDEAHKLKNEKTLNYSFIQSIKKKYCLLLTATPIQNNLLEIFNLVSIIKPGYLGDFTTFKKKFHKKKRLNKEDKQYLHKLIQNVMVRNKRRETLMHNVNRNIHTVWLQFSENEQQIYQTLDSVLKSFPIFNKLTYLKQLCSSREACYLSLRKNSDERFKKTVEPILQKIASLPHHAKAIKTVELIKQFGNEKVIIFTEYRATQYYLQWYLQQSGISSISFYGGMKRGRKEWTQQLFKNNYQVLIATEAGGEGINLQFCRYMINYDLPWNPMRLEQRIGRIHRYGQQNDMHIYNFAIKQTMEEHIMQLLYKKIDIFEQVIGKLDHILSQLNVKSIEEEINSIIKSSQSDGEIKIKMENFLHVFEHFSMNGESR